MSNGIQSSEVMRVLRDQLEHIGTTVDLNEASVVTQVGDGIARIAGLKTAMAGELLEFTSSRTGKSVYGLAQNLDEDSVGAVLFGDVDAIKEGDECRTTGRVMDIPVGHAMLGRVVNPLGQPIDGKGPIDTSHRRPIEFKAPGIMDRQPVCEPVQTGLLAIDAMVPIGRGQRELIIGDRKTGKTAIAIDALVNQRDTDTSWTRRSSSRPLLPIPRLCSTSHPWPVLPSASTSCTTTRTATPRMPSIPAAMS